MRVPIDSSWLLARRGACSPVSVRPVIEREGGRIVRTGVLAIAEGAVAPAPFWELLQWVAGRAEWLRATFALATRPACFGVARADGAAPAVGFCGTWKSAPRLTLLVAGRDIATDTIEAAAAACFSAAAPPSVDPFPPWRPGEPWLPVFWEQASASPWEQ